MSASQTISMRRRRARSSEDESPFIVASIAILAVVVFSCMGMIAPVLWDAFVGGPAPHWSQQSCSQGIGAGDAARCLDNARFQTLRPRTKAQFDPLIPHL
jgi:hypothetical protein